MNTTYITISGISFVLGSIASIWPRSSLDKFKQILQTRGENPNQRIGFSKMKKIDPDLFKKHTIGLLIWIPFGICFAVFALAAVFNK